MIRELRMQSLRMELVFPYVSAKENKSPDGLRFLEEPGVALIGRTLTNLGTLSDFLEPFNFKEYLNDPDILPCGTLLSKFAGQLCYLSLDDKRTRNKDTKKYFDNIKTQKHGSIFEHPTYTVLIYGIDRAVTHELVRHRAGTAFSQVSQRYVGPDKLRFVMPYEMQKESSLRSLFFKEIKGVYDNYVNRLSLMSKDEKRKVRQSFARRCLTNEVEAPIVVSGNVRAWRHILTKRVSEAADIGIRRPMYEVFRILREIEPEMFSDFEEVALDDGTYAVNVKFESV